MAKRLKKDDATLVSEFMEQLAHPLKPEIEVLRQVIKQAAPGIQERIKWNAPSYYCTQDFLTFNLRMIDKVHLIFHHVAIVEIQSLILQGDYKDRRMVYFKNMHEIEQSGPELSAVIGKIVQKIDAGQL